jgi:hypothetical protein
LENGIDEGTWEHCVEKAASDLLNDQTNPPQAPGVADDQATNMQKQLEKTEGGEGSTSRSNSSTHWRWWVAHLINQPRHRESTLDTAARCRCKSKLKFSWLQRTQGSFFC